MPKFNIRDVQKEMIAYIFTVEADTPEEALRKYTEELAGKINSVEDYPVDDSEESITIRT